MWRNRSNPTETNKMLYTTAGESFMPMIEQLNLLQEQIVEMEKYLESKQVPYTPGRAIILNWKLE